MYDVIVAGARRAGGPTAMLLVRRGYRVLLADRATFPSNTLSTHFIKPPGVEVRPAFTVDGVLIEDVGSRIRAGSQLRCQ